ncbi:hypothetical protein QJS10_CPA01g00943 [Acorus calamus]|uniref:Uncharacterized protein n=1 Tax=Acorus calamus TaxID=4465 RepID=A0AAV9FR12_ACOCL|nr:hypothetical protein QJS10_CPA01g00943 [Acorus calamus]
MNNQHHPHQQQQQQNQNQQQQQVVLHRKLRQIQFNVKRSLLERVSIFRRFFRLLWDRILACSTCKASMRYRRLNHSCPSFDNPSALVDNHRVSSDVDTDHDLVTLKIKYVGDVEEQRCLQMSGLNLMDKIFFVKGARIAFSIWDVGGDHQFLDHVPIACKDAAAILIMFDLTSRCTLNSVIGWYRQARKWNQTALPVLIGTKFDDFVQLPLDMQWEIVSQARSYSHAMNATLFFSSTTHKHVNKSSSSSQPGSSICRGP